MTAVRDLVEAHAVRAGEQVQRVHEALLGSVSTASVAEAQGEAARLAESAAALATALSDVEVRS